MTPPKTGHPALRNGLIFGAILGLLGFGNTLMQWVAGAYHLTNTGISSISINDTGGASFLGCFVFLAMLALTFVAGMLTAQGTRRVGSGAVAGLLTGVFGGLIGGIGSIVAMAVVVTPNLAMPPEASLTPSQIEVLVVAVVIFVSILVLLVEIGVGAGMGALGGLIGARGYHQPLPPAPQSYIPGYPGNAGISPQPGVAPQPWSYPQPTNYPPQPGNPPA